MFFSNSMGLFGFGKKPPVDRYAGKPFLRLIDCFVLKCIGELDASQESLLQQMAPKFQETFGISGTWDEIVSTQMNFPPEIETAIRNLWDKNQVIAMENGVTLTPKQFVEMFVRDNIGDM